MSDGKLFSRSKSAELRAELEQAFKKSKPHNRVKIVLKKIISNIILNNNELVNLMPDVTKLMKIDDLEIRKMCFHYLISYGHLNPVAASDALPFLKRFNDDSSPIMRALAIRTISSISNKEFVDLGFKSIRRLLKDSDPYVRKSAAFAVSRLYQHDRQTTIQENLIDDLNELLYDSNQMVVANALAALSYITEQGKSLTLTIDKNHSMTLISYLSKTNEWCQVYILNSLMSYVPRTTEEALDLIEASIPSIQHENSAVVLNAIKVIVYYSNYVKNPELVLPSLPKRLGSSLASLLSKPPEIQFLVLRNVILLLLGKKELVNFEVEMFFCKYDDPIYVKDTKLEIIYLLANEQNVSVVLRELEEYATEVDVAMARKAIRAFGNLAVKLSNASDECVNILCDLVSNGISYIVQESAIVMKNILRKYPGRFNFAIEELLTHYTLIDEPDAKTSIIWILGQYCEIIEDVENIFEDFVSTFKDDPIEVQYATLTAVTKFYLKVPSNGEPFVIKVLKRATEEVDNPDIRERGFMYWRLISSENAHDINGSFQENTKNIILNANPIISTDSDNIDPSILEELELNIGTLASIYLKPIQHVFRTAKRRHLPYSPALQEKPLPTPPNSANTPNDHLNSISHQQRPLAQAANSMSSDNMLTVKRNNSSRSSNRHSSILRQKSFDSGFSGNEESSTPKNSSLVRRISRKASLLTRKNNKYL